MAPWRHFAQTHVEQRRGKTFRGELSVFAYVAVILPKVFQQRRGIFGDNAHFFGSLNLIQALLSIRGLLKVHFVSC